MFPLAGAETTDIGCGELAARNYVSAGFSIRYDVDDGVR